MASVGHVVVGMAGARIAAGGDQPRVATMFWWSALSMLPDADVIGFAFGIQYGDAWGHRGATHSLLMAAAVGAGIGLLAARKRTWIVATAVAASHGLLDTLTDGGLGIALLWPFDLMRYFAPWRPIPVSPIGLGYLSRYGLFVALTELVLFAPLIVYALYPRRLIGSRSAPQ